MFFRLISVGLLVLSGRNSNQGSSAKMNDELCERQKSLHISVGNSCQRYDNVKLATTRAALKIRNFVTVSGWVMTMAIQPEPQFHNIYFKE